MPQMDTPKIVVDSNVFVSAALAINGKRLDSPSAVVFFKVVQRDVVAVASPQMLYELAGKLSEPRFELSAAFVIDFINLLADAVEMVAIRGLDMGCRDERDNMFIETAYNGRVDALVTRDRDLQDAQTRYDLAKRKCQILNVTELLAYLREMPIQEDLAQEQSDLPDSPNTDTAHHTNIQSTSSEVAVNTHVSATATLSSPSGYEYRWLSMHAGNIGNGVFPPQIGSTFEQEVFTNLTREGWRVVQAQLHPGYQNTLLILLEKRLAL